MRRHPHLYEVNAWLFLRRLSQKYGRPLTLATVPEAEWQVLTRRGFDLVWLMGVWQRSPGARQKALHDEALRRDYDRVLPGWKDDDIAGSPFAVFAYELDHSLGQPEELAQLRSKLNELGLGLILDFVPNHVALDHPWTRSHPQCFIRVKGADVKAHPEAFFAAEGGHGYAHGRDPNFPPWTDTAQLNFFSPDLRQALIEELRRLAGVADGVRCDMAMLALNDVFQGVWGGRAGYPRPDTEFWGEAITRVKQQSAGFLFLAEAYWGLEAKLLQLGFDFAYDKTLYDRLRFANPGDIRNYLRADEADQQRSLRFIENHDEERAVTAFGRERSLAAAVVLATLPGLRLFHDGQLEGHRLRLPVELVREPPEADDADITQFYEKLLTVGNSPSFHEGKWSLLDTSQGGEGNDSYQHLLAWCWQLAERCKIVAVNYAPAPSQGWLRLPATEGRAEQVILFDELSGKTHFSREQSGSQGLRLDLKPWEAQILNMPLPGG